MPCTELIILAPGNLWLTPKKLNVVRSHDIHQDPLSPLFATVANTEISPHGFFRRSIVHCRQE